MNDESTAFNSGGDRTTLYPYKGQQIATRKKGAKPNNQLMEKFEFLKEKNEIKQVRKRETSSNPEYSLKYRILIKAH